MGWEIFLLIMFVIYIVSTLVCLCFGLIKLFYNIKCRKIHSCVNDECKFRGYCKRTKISPKEIAELRALISQLGD